MSVELIAHRGAHDRDPENTLAAFVRAAALAFDAVELDVHATADGTVVVHHDDVVVTAAGPLRIADATEAQLRRAAPGLPRLDAVLEAVRDRLGVYVEVKGAGIEEPVAAVLRGCRAEVAVHAFDHRVVRRLRALLPDVPGGVLVVGRLVDPVAALRAAAARDLWQWHEAIDAELTDAVSSAGGRVLAWTANSAAAWPVLEQLGVAAICTDLPPTAT